MTLETLQKIRIVVPGIMIFLFAIPLFQDELSPSGAVSSLNVLQGAVYLLVIAFLGGIYYFFNFRSWANRWSEEKIRANIKTKLLEPFKNDAAISASFDKLKQGRGLLNVFYGYIDNDLSLKEKTKLVYWNGAFWSTVADIRVIGAIAFFVYIGAYIIRGNPSHFIVSLIMAGLFMLSFLLMPIITKRHMELGNDQIDYILLKYKDDLKDKLGKLAGA